jgi:SpoVK/Ycf46/Vps4 family AAA+-type ATPase
VPHHGLDENLQRVFHEARLQHAIIFFDEADEMFTDRRFNGAMPTLLRELERLDGICILATNRRQVLDEALDRRILYKLDFEVPPPEQREEIWRRHLPAQAPLADDIDLAALSQDFEFSGGYIKNAVLTAMTVAVQRQGAERRITQADLRQAATLQRLNRLTAHADKVQPRVSLEDVVVDEQTRSQIDAFIAAARQRTTVFSTWGFGRKASRGRGLAGLLSGPSGTGKNMTAEAIAGALGQNLYPIRMDSLISKFVGETEKHLAAVFAAARDTEAVVFFDEADALFTRRLDGQDHHAHYINQQINMLLTELEKFDGVVLLASNRPEALDPAFERRIRYHIRFNLPHPSVRADLWRKMIPHEAPLDATIDFDELADAFEFSGGTIRSVVLRAAFAAANNGRLITRQLLFDAAEAEAPLQGEKLSIGFHG